MRLAIAMGALALATGGAASAEEHSYDLSDFEAVSVATGITAIISVGGDYAVRAEGSAEDLEKLKLEVRRGELQIARKNKWTGVGRSTRITVAVSMPALESLDVSTGSETTATGIDADSFAIDASTGAVAKISGECGSLSIDVSTGAEVDAREFRCKTASADAAMGGVATIFASESISGDAAFGGEVRVYGEPQSVSKDTSFGGEVTIVK